MHWHPGLLYCLSEGITNPTGLRALNTSSNQNPKGWTSVEQSLHQFNLLGSRPWQLTWEHQSRTAVSARAGQQQWKKISYLGRNVFICTYLWHYRVKQTLIQTRSPRIAPIWPPQVPAVGINMKTTYQTAVRCRHRAGQLQWNTISNRERILSICTYFLNVLKIFICSEMHWQSYTHISEIFVWT